MHFMGGVRTVSMRKPPSGSSNRALRRPPGPHILLFYAVQTQRVWAEGNGVEELDACERDESPV